MKLAPRAASRPRGWGAELTAWDPHRRRGLARSDRVALVALLLARGEGNLGLDEPVLQVDAKGDQRLLVVVDALFDLLDLLSVKEQLARAAGIVGEGGVGERLHGQVLQV